ncbi:fibronectin type III domain-containing protein [Streptomyces sp. NPDC056600]|uniref:fibronectin type III domain-containing protein n=1 Tax=Streptomyces sp. NPDC056600 TaxID=3345874 RepID=UPI0036BDADDA
MNWTGSADVKFAYTPRTTATVDKVKPLTPGGAALTYSTSTYKSKLSWTRNPEMDLAGYQVYRRVSGGSYPTKPLAVTTASATSYTDTPPMDGKLYYYEVRAYDKAGNTSTGTADKGVTTVDLTGPAAPTGLTGGTDLYGARLSWNAVADATRYEVLWQDPQTGERTKVGSSAQTSFHDWSHYAGVFLVRGYDTAGNPGALSAPFTVDGVDRTPPAAPYGLKALVRPGQVFLTFNTPEEPLWGELANGARVYVYRTRGTGPDAETVEVQCREGDEDTYMDDPYSWADGEMIFSCVDRTGEPDTTYTYTAGVTDGRGNASERSTPVTVNTTDRTAPAPLTGLTATPRADGVLLRWDVPADDIASYRVRRAVTGSDGTVQWQDVSCTFTYEDMDVRLCPNLPDGEKATYSVRAMDEFDNVLAPDDPSVPTVTVTELVVLPGDPVVTTSGPLTASPRSGGPATVAATWHCSGVDECADITEYRVSVWGDTGWRPAGSVRGGAQGWVRYSDPEQLLGSTTWYQVVGVRADGTELLAIHTYAIRYDQY